MEAFWTRAETDSFSRPSSTTAIDRGPIARLRHIVRQLQGVEWHRPAGCRRASLFKTRHSQSKIAPDPLAVVAVARSELLSEILLFRQDGDEVHDEKRHGRED